MERCLKCEGDLEVIEYDVVDLFEANSDAVIVYLCTACGWTKRVKQSAPVPA